jgi:AcrR family transcriptional regulator
MRELAGKLGVSAMTPYRYFKDKDEILSAIRARAFNCFADRLEKTLAQPGTPAEKSQALGRAYVRFAREFSCRYRLMFDLSFLHLSPVPELTAAEQRARATMTEHVRQLVKEGYYSGDPELIGSVLWAGLHGVITMRLGGTVMGDSEFEIILAETMRAISSAYRSETAPV